MVALLDEKLMKVEPAGSVDKFKNTAPFLQKNLSCLYLFLLTPIDQAAS